VLWPSLLAVYGLDALCTDASAYYCIPLCATSCMSAFFLLQNGAPLGNDGNAIGRQNFLSVLFIVLLLHSARINTHAFIPNFLRYTVLCFQTIYMY